MQCKDGRAAFDRMFHGATSEHTHISKGEDHTVWTVDQTLVDSEELNDWLVEFSVDLTESKASGKVSLAIIGIGPLRAH